MIKTKPTLLVLLGLLFSATTAFSQTARVQIIHNAPEPVVDIYVNGGLLLDDFTFRSATPFQDVPAGVMLDIAVAPGTSTSAADAIANFPVMLTDGETYTVMAAGVVGTMGATAFNLFVNPTAREAAADPANVDVNVFHGSPDAPAVDVDAVFVADNVVDNLAFGAYTGYLSLPAGKYDLAIQPAGTNTTVASFRADLSGLAGGAATVFASGFLQDTPAFGLFAALPNGTVVELPLTPTARVQIIHNSPEPTVDVYVGNSLLADNFAFRTATPFIDVPADRDLNIGIAGENSTSAADAIANFPANLVEGETYTVMAAGVVGTMGATAFNLFVNPTAREAAGDPANVDVNVFHGSPDAPAVDVDAVFVADNVVDNLAFGEYTGYLSLPAGKYDLAIQPAGTNTTVASFRADLSGLAGGAATVFASGFLQDTPAFGLFAALPNGTVVELPLTPTARVQIIHNSPEPIVDVYVGNSLLADNFAFRTATPFIDVPADRDLNIGIAGENSTSAADAIANFPANLAEGETYTVMAAGVVGTMGATAFNLFVNPTAREAAGDPANVDVNVFHGSPDAPAVDVDAVFVADNVVDNLAFGEYTGYLSLPAGKYDLAIQPAGTNTTVASFRADLSGLAGGAATVFASGFLQDTPAFGLFAALPNGTVVELPLTPTARVQIIHNSPEPTVDVYVGNSLVIDNFEFRDVLGFTDLPADRDINVGIAPENSTSAADAIANFPFVLEANRAYVISAAGVVGNTGTMAFDLFVDPNAQELSGNDDDVALQVFHGSPDAPEIDVILPDGTVLFDNVAFGDYTGYITVPSAVYEIRLTPANDNTTIVAAYRLDVVDDPGQGLIWAGRAFTLFASGYLSDTPSFGIYAAQTDLAIPLQLVTSTNNLAQVLTGLQLFPNPNAGDFNLAFELKKEAQIRYRIVNTVGRVVAEGDFTKVPGGYFNQRVTAGNLPAGMYYLELLSDQGNMSARFMVK